MKYYKLHDCTNYYYRENNKGQSDIFFSKKKEWLHCPCGFFVELKRRFSSKLTLITEDEFQSELMMQELSK